MAFARGLGFMTSHRDGRAPHLRDTWPGAPRVIGRKGRGSRFLGPAFRAADPATCCAWPRPSAPGSSTSTALPPPLGGTAVDVLDPGGLRVRVIPGTDQLPALPAQRPQRLNFAGRDRANATQRPPREPAGVRSLGHVVLRATTFRRTPLRQSARPDRSMAPVRCDRAATRPTTTPLP